MFASDETIRVCKKENNALLRTYYLWSFAYSNLYFCFEFVGFVVVVVVVATRLLQINKIEKYFYTYVRCHLQ
jgi:hypothetical protein